MKTKAHKYITKLAIEKCNLDFTNKDIKYILKGTHHEDYYPLKTRATNWHFYRLEPNSKIPNKVKKGPFWCKPTSEDIFNTHINYLHSPGLSRKNYFKTLGKILHHIQDMSTPSHVVPIYHGPGESDSYEKYMMSYIRKMQLGNNVLINRDLSNYNDIYHNTALKTLDYLEEANIEVTNLDNEQEIISFEKIWTKFYQGNGKIEGFGSFGPLANCFNINKGSNKYISKDGYIVRKTEIKKIYQFLSDKAIQDTCDALMYFQKYNPTLH